MNSPAISAIVPTWNEEHRIGACLQSLIAGGGDIEVLVSDAGSIDRTVEIARSFTSVRVLECSTRGRAHQMNYAVSEARGKIFWFVHADSRVHTGAVEEIHRVLSDPEVSAGAFRFEVDSVGASYRVIEWGVRLRSELCGLPYGDQGLFLRREDFDRLGRFPEVPILEDVYLVKNAKRHGKVKVSALPLITSGRRWENDGVLKTTFVNIGAIFLHRFGVSPEVLARRVRPTSASRE